MNPLDPLREELAARHAQEVSDAPAAFETGACLLVAVEPEREYFLLPEAGIAIPFGAVGGRELTVEAVEFEPADLAGFVDASVARVRDAGTWVLHEVRLGPRGDPSALVASLARLDRLVVRLRCDAENAADFSLPVSFLLGRIRVEPPEVDLGTVPYFGDTLVEAEGSTIVLIEAGRPRRSLELPPATTTGYSGTIALGDGVHRLELPGGVVRTLRIRPFERMIRFHNDSLRPVRLEATPDPDAAVLVVPAAFEIAPGDSAAVRVRFLPGRARWLGRQTVPVPFRLELAGHERILPGRIQVPVSVDLRCDRAVLSFEGRSIDLGRRRLDQGDPTFILPYRLVGKGKVRLDVRFEPDLSGLFELEKDYGVLRNKGEEVAPGFLSVRIDARRWFERHLERFRVVLSTDAPLLNRRTHEFEGRLELTGVALAHRMLRFECHQGLLYQIPIAVWAEEAPADLELGLVEVRGTPADLADRLSVSEWHHLEAIEPRILDVIEAARPPGPGYSLHPAVSYLLLDLSGLDEPESFDADWVALLRDPSTRWTRELRLAVRIHSAQAFLTGEVLTRTSGANPRTRLEFEVANPTDRPLIVREVSVEPVRFGGLEPVRVEPRVRIAPGRSKKFGLDLRIGPRSPLVAILDALVSAKPSLRLTVRTDLPGNHAIVRTMRFRRRPSSSPPSP